MNTSINRREETIENECEINFQREKREVLKKARLWIAISKALQQRRNEKKEKKEMMCGQR